MQDPAVLGLRPPRHLDLEPCAHRASDVQAVVVLGHQPLVTPLEDLGPGLEAVRRQPAGCVDQVGAGDEVLEPWPPLAERPLADVAALHVEHVKRDEHGRRGELGGLAVAQPVEARAELLIEHTELAVKHQRPDRQRGDSPRRREGSGGRGRRLHG